MATIKKIGTELNWDIEKGATRGKISGFGVSVVQHTNFMAKPPTYKTMVITFDAITNDQSNALMTFINNNKKQLRVLNYKISSSFLNIYVNENFKALNAARLTEAINLLTEGFATIGINPPSKCIYCGTETTEEIVERKVAYRSHRGCHSKASEESKELEKNVKYGLGILGAVLGAGVFNVIYFVAVFLGYYISYIMIPVGIASYFGYKWIGGTFTSKAKWMIVGVSVVTILLTLLLSVTLDSIFFEVGFIEVLTDTELDLGSVYAFSLLWGLAGISTGYGLAKRQEF